MAHCKAALWFALSEFGTREISAVPVLVGSPTGENLWTEKPCFHSTGLFRKCALNCENSVLFVRIVLKDIHNKCQK